MVRVKKKEQLRTLTWKYFFKYKIIETTIMIALGLLVWIGYIYRQWFIDNQKLLGNIVGWIIVTITIIIILAIWISYNWEKAENNAKEKLGIKQNVRGF